MASCGRKSDEKSEEEEAVMPEEVASLIMGDSYSADTLYVSENATYVLIDNADYLQHILYGPDGVIFNSPTAIVDSLGSGSYMINDVLGAVHVDFALPASVSSLKAAYPQYGGFSQLNVYGANPAGQKAVYGYSVDVPASDVRNSDAVTAWLKTCITDSVKPGISLKQIGETFMQEFFDQNKTVENQWLYSSIRSMLVHEITDAYLTYEDYFYGFTGGAHGIYTIRFVSYDQLQNAPVTYTSLFRDDCEDEVRELIFESIADNDDYMSSHKLTSLSQLKSYIGGNLNGDPLPIPDPGLLKEGMVFCYQPYEIGPYSDGALQVVVPYSKIQELLKRTETSR